MKIIALFGNDNETIKKYFLANFGLNCNQDKFKTFWWPENEYTLPEREPIHPSKHSENIDKFLKQNSSYDFVVIITHSEYVFNHLRILVIDGKLNKDDLQIFFIKNEDEFGFDIQKIEILESGSVKKWPHEFMMQSMRDSGYILRNIKKL